MLRYSFLILPLALSSCGVIDDLLDSAEVAARADELQEFVDLAEEIESAIDGGESPNVDILTEEQFNARTGEATYTGFAGLLVPDGNGEIALTADADMTANFDNDTVTASFDNWLGIRLDADGNNDGLAYDASGNINITNGAFVLNGGDISFTANANGTLDTEENDTFTVNGGVEGSIGTNNNNNTETLAAGGTEDLVVTMNGNAVDDAQFGFGGEINN